LACPSMAMGVIFLKTWEYNNLSLTCKRTIGGLMWVLENQ